MSPPRVVRLSESEWRLFAVVRLRALADALGADDPQYRQESSFTAAQWRRRLREHAQFAVTVDDVPVGLIAAQQANADSIYLYSLWLDPTARGHGLARALITEVLQWARDRHARTVSLRVAADNSIALGVYESLGFVVADAEPHAGELVMSLSVN